MDFSGFIENLKAHEIKMKVREGRDLQRRNQLHLKQLPQLWKMKSPWTKVKKTSPCLFERWGKCSTRRDVKATSEEQVLKAKMKERVRK